MPWKNREQRNEYQRAYRLKLGMKPRVSRARERTSCLNCDQPIGRTSTKFCSSRCQRTHEHLQFVAKWLNGEAVGGSAAGVSRHIRRYLLAEGGKGVRDAAGVRDTRQRDTYLWKSTTSTATMRTTGAKTCEYSARTATP